MARAVILLGSVHQTRAGCALGPIIVALHSRSRRLATRCSVGLTPHAHSEVAGKRRDRRLALDSPFCCRWRVASSRRLPLEFRATMIGQVALLRRAAAGCGSIRKE